MSAVAVDSVTVKPFFDDLNNDDIHDHKRPYKQKIRECDGDKTEETPRRCESYRDSGQDNEYAADDQEPAGMTFIERYPGGPDGKNDECLGAERFEKPDCPEYLHRCMEYHKEAGKGEEIKQGTDRSEYEQKFFDETDIPPFWRKYVLLINRIGRNCRLGDVVEKVIKQYLDRKEGKERQKE